jgi:hypothetical protein
VRLFEDWCTLEEARQRGVQWIVLRRDYFMPGGPHAAKFTASAVNTRSAFYRDLASAPDARKAATFEADPDGAPGYDLEIWRLVTPAAQPSLALPAGNS